MQGDFTKQAEEFFINNIDELYSTENAIEYLNDKRNTMNFSFELRRFICKKFGEKTKDNKYICLLKNEKEERKIILDSYDLDNFSLKEYEDLILFYGKKNNVHISRADGRRWVKDEVSCKRHKLFQISFALEMTIEETNMFLTKILCEQGYNFRNEEEIIYYFCRKNNISYNRATELIEIVSNIEDNKKLEDKDIYTKHFKKEVEAINSEEELLDYIKKNKHNFKGFSKTAKEKFIEALNTALELAKLKENFKNMNKDKLEQVMLDGYPRGEKKYGEDEKECRKEFESVKGSRIKDILDNITKRDKMDAIIKDKRAVTRKDLIFLNFFNRAVLSNGEERVVHNGKYGEESKYYFDLAQNNPIENMKSFREEMDDILMEVSMGKLYIPNRFDNFILLSLCYDKPLEYFADLIEESFEDKE
ncbi:MAG: hypothetical protein ACLRRH_10645 [Clostridium sp.]